MLNTGEKSIIFLLSYNNFRISKLRLIKLMFLISKRTSLYDFFPYRYGPFSFKLYHDLSTLERKGYLSIDDNIINLLKPELPDINYRKKNIIRMYNQKFSNIDDKMLLDYIYEEYPQYTIFSFYMRNQNYERNLNGITTVGYEGKSIDKFLAEIIKNKINVVMDIRRNPYSKKFGFQGDKLKDYLAKIDVEYMHIPELGIASEQRRNLKSPEDYLNLFEDYKKTLSGKAEFLDVIKTVSKNKKISLMCFEKDVNQCHRGVLARMLRDEGIEVYDI